MNQVLYSAGIWLFCILAGWVTLISGYRCHLVYICVRSHVKVKEPLVSCESVMFGWAQWILLNCASLDPGKNRHPWDPSRGHPCWLIVLVQENANFYLYKPCAMCLTLLLSRLLHSGSEPGLPLSLREGPCLSLTCRNGGEPNELVVFVSLINILICNSGVLR